MAPAAAAAGAAASPADEELDAHFVDDRASTEGLDAGTTLVVDAPEDDAVYVASPAYDAETLAEIFGGTVDGDRARVPLPPDGRIDVDFCTQKAGEFTFTITGVDSGASDTATVTVVDVATGLMHFRDTVLKVETDDVARIRVEHRLDRACMDSTPMRIVVGSRDAGFLLSVNLTVHEGDPSPTTLFLDLKSAGQGPPETYLLVENATLENATLHTDGRERPLGPGEYDVSLYDRGDEVDIATLVVREPTPTPTDTPTPTETPTREPTPPEHRSPTPPDDHSPTDAPSATTPERPLEGEETDSPTTVPGPGFAGVLVAVAVAGWYARRR